MVDKRTMRVQHSIKLPMKCFAGERFVRVAPIRFSYCVRQRNVRGGQLFGEPVSTRPITVVMRAEGDWLVQAFLTPPADLFHSSASC